MNDNTDENTDGNNNNASISRLFQLLTEIQRGQTELRAEIRAGFGTTYVALEKVWQVKPTLFKGSAEKLRKFRAKYKEVLAIYQQADGSNLPEQQLQRYQHPFDSQSMFPGTFGRNSLAHLVPEDPISSLTWGEAAALCTGKDNVKNMLESQELRNFVRGNTDDATNPFKLWAWDYLQLPDNHAEYFDNVKKEKAVIITPIWDPNEEWKPGTGYKLLVTATQEGHKWLMGNQPLPEDASQHGWLGSASNDDYRTATLKSL
jgi:hypothetical protein